MLKTPLKFLLAASIALPASLLSGAADAGHKNKHHYSGHHYSGHYYKPRYYGYGYYPRYGYYGYHHGHHGNAGKYLGVALLGLGLGYVLTRDNDKDYDQDRYEDDYYRDDAYRSQSRPRYVSPPTSGYQSGAVETESYQSRDFDFSQCEETRDYETTIYFDGQPAQAYGTACLMPDGTWVAGPMQVQ